LPNEPFNPIARKTRSGFTAALAGTGDAVTDPKWFDGYSGQSANELVALASEYRIDSIVLAFEQALLEKLSSVALSDLNEVELTVLAVEALEREVNNGGYHQFFLNAAEHASSIVAALERIDCPNTAKISQAAIAHLGVQPPFTIEQVQIALEQDTDGNLIDVLSDRCDPLYYDSGEPIADRLFAYIRAKSHAIQLGK
jgi:hypothetical protein